MSAGKKGLPQSFFRRIFFDEPRRIERTVACSDFHSVFVVHSVAEQQEQIIWHWVEQMRRRSAGEEQQRVEGGLAWKETLMRSIQEGRETRRTMWEQQKAWPGGGRAAQLKNADLAAGRRLSLSCRFVHAQVFPQPLISQRRGIVFLCVSFVDTQVPEGHIIQRSLKANTFPNSCNGIHWVDTEGVTLWNREYALKITTAVKSRNVVDTACQQLNLLFPQW